MVQSCSSRMTYLYSIRVPAGSSTSAVHMSPGPQIIGTLAIDRKLQPKGISDPPTHSICLLCTRYCTLTRTRTVTGSGRGGHSLGCGCEGCHPPPSKAAAPATDRSGSERCCLQPRRPLLRGCELRLLLVLQEELAPLQLPEVERACVAAGLGRECCCCEPRHAANKPLRKSWLPRLSAPIRGTLELPAACCTPRCAPQDGQLSPTICSQGATQQ